MPLQEAEADTRTGTSKALAGVEAVRAAEEAAEASIAAAKAAIPAALMIPAGDEGDLSVGAHIAADGSAVIDSGRGVINLQPDDAYAVGLWLVDAYASGQDQ